MFEGNVSHTWKLWFKQFHFYLTTTEKDNEDDKTGSSVDDEMKLETVLNKFSKYCNPRKNVTILRHNFFTYRQPEGQSFNNFITELKKLSDE